MGIEFQVCKIKNVLEMELWLYNVNVTLLNCAFKNG